MPGGGMTVQTTTIRIPVQLIACHTHCQVRILHALHSVPAREFLSDHLFIPENRSLLSHAFASSMSAQLVHCHQRLKASTPFQSAASQARCKPAQRNVVQAEQRQNDSVRLVNLYVDLVTNQSPNMHVGSGSPGCAGSP